MLDPHLPAMAWVFLVALALVISIGLAAVARHGRRRLWQAVGLVVFVLVATLPLTDGSLDYKIGCGLYCGGVVRADVPLIFIATLVVACVLSLRRQAHWAHVVTATALSIAIFTLTASRAVA